MVPWLVSTSQVCLSSMGALGWVAVALGALALAQAFSVVVAYKRYRLEYRVHFPYEEDDETLSPADILGEP